MSWELVHRTTADAVDDRSTVPTRAGSPAVDYHEPGADRTDAERPTTETRPSDHE